MKVNASIQSLFEEARSLKSRGEYEKAIELEPNSKIAKLCKEKINQLFKTKEKTEKFWGKSDWKF